MSVTSVSCPRCGRINGSSAYSCVSCGWLFVDPRISPHTAEQKHRTALLGASERKRRILRRRTLLNEQEQTGRISRRAALLGLAGSAGALALGGVVWIWSRKTHPPLLTYMGHHGATINALAWSPDGDYIASGDANGTILIWDSFTGATVQTFREPAAKNVSSLAWSPENTSSVLAGYPNMLVIWDARSGKPTFTTTSLTGPADYSPLGTYKQCYLRYPLLLAACQNQASVLVFPAASLNTPIASIDAGSIHTLAFSPFQEQLGLAFVTATPPQKLVVYGAYINTTCAQDGPANATISYKKFDMPDPGKAGVAELSIPWGQGRSYLLAGSLPGTVMIQGTWGTYEMDHPAEVVAAAICPGEHPLPANANPDGWSTVIGYIATADSTGVVRIWGNDQKYLVAMQSRQPVLQLAWSPDGSALAVVSADGTVQVWQANLSSLDALWRNTSFN